VGRHASRLYRCLANPPLGGKTLRPRSRGLRWVAVPASRVGRIDPLAALVGGVGGGGFPYERERSGVSKPERPAVLYAAACRSTRLDHHPPRLARGEPDGGKFQHIRSCSSARPCWLAARLCRDVLRRPQRYPRQLDLVSNAGPV